MPNVFTSTPVANPHPLRAQNLRGGRSGRSDPKFNVRDFVDVEKALRLMGEGLQLHVNPLVDFATLIRVWKMYLNDRLGDCTCASVAHGLMVFAAMIGVEITITEADIEHMYEHSGWKPTESEATDQGWTLEAAAEFEKTIGLRGTPGIEGWAGVSPSDDEEQHVAMALFGGLSTGIECPKSTLEQFQEGKPFTVVPGSEIAGGHAIWKVTSHVLASGLVQATGSFVRASEYVTWGGVAPADEAWDKTYVDEHIAFVPIEWEAKLPEEVRQAGIIDFSKLATLVSQYS
jgi:hypothetical protein